jgi:Cytochrome b5-like Heme/Steroid binding domain
MADEVKASETVEAEVGFLYGIVHEVINSPLNLALIAIITFLIFKIFKSRQPPKPSPPAEPELPKLRKDFTVAELKAFDGNQPDGRVLVAVNGAVYDVSRGKRFYGPGESICCSRAAPFFLFFKVPVDWMFTVCSLSVFSLPPPILHNAPLPVFGNIKMKIISIFCKTCCFRRRVYAIANVQLASSVVSVN